LAERLMQSNFSIGEVGWLPNVLSSMVNGFYEELFLCGYMMTVLHKRFGETIAVNASNAMRLAYHLYQGPIVALTIIPMGLLFSVWYVRTNRLWPLVVAHVLLDILLTTKS
jgi:uncharacterized protein